MKRPFSRGAYAITSVKFTVIDKHHIFKSGKMSTTMRVYIAYKYSNILDKQALISQVTELAESLEKKGHETFVLGRDVQNWGNKSLHSIKKISEIIKNLKQADLLLAFVNSDVPSNGLFFEMLIAKLLGKKTMVAVKEGMESIQVCCAKPKQYVFFNKPSDIAGRL